MSIKTLRFDASEAVETAADEAEYLADAFGTNDPATVAHALGVVARARGMSQIARQAGMQREHLYRALSDAGSPELNTVLQVLKALGLRLTVAPAEAAA